VVSGSMSDMLRLGAVPMEELFEAREWILSTLVRPACRRITPLELQKLRDNVAEAELLHQEGRYEERVDRNFEFHSLLAEATRNAVAVMVVRGLSDALRGLIAAVGTDLSPNFFSSRRELLKAIETGDEESASRKMTQIVKATEQIYQRLAQERVRTRKSVYSRTDSKRVGPTAARAKPAAKPARSQR
jgi:GntR family transcriptional repressor for pyruvate dehydrogenase complex